MESASRSHLKKKILVQNQGGTKFQPAGILKYVEDLKRGPNAEFGPKDFFESAYRSHLKKKILVQNQGGTKLQPAGILKYVEDLKRGPNAEFGPKDFFEMASNQNRVYR